MGLIKIKANCELVPTVAHNPTEHCPIEGTHTVEVCREYGPTRQEMANLRSQLAAEKNRAVWLRRAFHVVEAARAAVLAHERFDRPPAKELTALCEAVADFDFYRAGRAGSALDIPDAGNAADLLRGAVCLLILKADALLAEMMDGAKDDPRCAGWGRYWQRAREKCMAIVGDDQEWSPPGGLLG